MRINQHVVFRNQHMGHEKAPDVCARHTPARGLHLDEPPGGLEGRVVRDGQDLAGGRAGAARQLLQQRSHARLVGLIQGGVDLVQQQHPLAGSGACGLAAMPQAHAVTGGLRQSTPRAPGGCSTGTHTLLGAAPEHLLPPVNFPSLQ
jgi:hypothetical protein